LGSAGGNLGKGNITEPTQRTGTDEKRGGVFFEVKNFLRKETDATNFGFK
jgi:hypothetical protein